MADEITPSGTSTDSGTSQSTTGTASSTPASPAQATGTGPSNTGYTYTEDRSSWIPPHRLREETQKRQQAERAATENATLRRQIQALTGTTQADPQQAKADQIRQEFFGLFPQFKKLAELDPQKFEQLLSSPDQIAASQENISQGWAKHGRQTLGSLVSTVSDAIGGELSPRAQSRLKAAFTSLIEQEVQQSNQTGQPSKILQQYMDGDEALVASFAKEWQEDFLEPARRKLTSQAIPRVDRKVPNSGARSQVTSVQRPTEFSSLDERLDYAVKVAKERGMQFGE